MRFSVHAAGSRPILSVSFGIAIVSRLLESLGFKVAMIAQPVKDADFLRFGAPRYGWWVTGGNIDSMVAHYTAAKRRRSDDAYTPGGKAGRRPDRATIVYCNRIRTLFPDAQIVIGGLEASMRRFAHYDYWSDTVLPSILLDSNADLLIFGMGEHQTAHIARELAQGVPAGSIRCRGVCYLANQLGLPTDAVSVASYAKVRENKLSYAKAAYTEITEQDAVRGRKIIQKHGDDLYLVQTEPALPLTTEELDAVFALPFERMYHPHTPAATTPAMKPWAECPALRRWSFPLPTTGGALEAAISVRSHSIRAALSPAEALNPSFARRKVLCRIPASRGSSVMWAVRPQTSGTHPAKNSSPKGPAPTGNALPRPRVQPCRSITANTSICSAACVRSKGYGGYLCGRACGTTT